MGNPQVRIESKLSNSRPEQEETTTIAILYVNISDTARQHWEQYRWRRQYAPGMYLDIFPLRHENQPAGVL